jgi:phosphoribosylformylglycinamidine synthase
MLLGNSTGHVGQSLWLEICHGRREGAPPSVDLTVERRLGELARQLIGAGLVKAVHDISDGGALTAIAEMALAVGIGVTITLPNVPNPAAILFGEDQGRLLVTTTDPEAVKTAATAAKIFSAPIGQTGGKAVSGPGFNARLSDLHAAHEGFFPKLMGSELTPEF